jgi:hypothetical protein
MPKTCGWQRLPGGIQLDVADPMMQPFPDFSNFSTMAWEHILLQRNDCYTVCHCALCKLSG